MRMHAYRFLQCSKRQSINTSLLTRAHTHTHRRVCELSSCKNASAFYAITKPRTVLVDYSIMPMSGGCCSLTPLYCVRVSCLLWNRIDRTSLVLACVERVRNTHTCESSSSSQSPAHEMSGNMRSPLRLSKVYGITDGTPVVHIGGSFTSKNADN